MHIYTEQDYSGRWIAVDENYNGDDDCIVGQGKTEYEAMDNYLGEYADRMGIKK